MAITMRRQLKIQPEEMGYRCLCCYDDGLIRTPELLLPDYDPSSDVPLVCNRNGCEASEKRYRPTGKSQDSMSESNWDTRHHLNMSATPQECETLHQIAMDGFRAKEKDANVERVRALIAEAPERIAGPANPQEATGIPCPFVVGQKLICSYPGFDESEKKEARKIGEAPVGQVVTVLGTIWRDPDSELGIPGYWAIRVEDEAGKIWPRLSISGFGAIDTRGVTA